MTDRRFDVIVADGEPGSLALGVHLVRRGRTVGVVDLSSAGGTATVSVSAARHLDPVRSLVEAAPIVTRRVAKVLQPEGALGVEFASERLSDAGAAVVVLKRSEVAARLAGAIVDHGGRLLPAPGGLSIDTTGFVSGYRHTDGETWAGRCVVLAPSEVERLTALPEAPTSPPAEAIESEWSFALDGGVVQERFGLAEGEAAEWWLYGDPFDGAAGFGRLRAFGNTVTLAVVVLLAEVLAKGLSIDRLATRLRQRPAIASMLVGAEMTGVAGRTVPLGNQRADPTFGDGWVAAPGASAGEVQPLTTELAMAELIADTLDHALSARRVSSARLASLAPHLREVRTAATMAPLEPIDAWADELVGKPARLVDGARLLAERFPSAG